MKLLRAVSLALLTASALLLAGTVTVFVFRWDKAAAATTIPFTAWATAGIALALAAAAGLRRPRHRGSSGSGSGSRRALVLACLWAIAGSLGADETAGVLRSLADRPSMAPPQGHQDRPVIRVITHNCGNFTQRPDAARHLARFHPDLVFLQESPNLGIVRQLCTDLFGDGGEGAYLYRHDCSILARGKLTHAGTQEPGTSRSPDLVHATWTTPSGDTIQLLNLHLLPGVTDLRLWRPDTWRRHYHNRLERKRQLDAALDRLTPSIRTIIAGDFNAGAADASFQLLEPEFTDTYHHAGTGWPNTFSNHLPLVRIDQAWTNQHFQAVRHATFKSPSSDHRIVVADLVATDN